MNPNRRFLANEISLELLGNKFYDLDGNCVPDLNTLCIGNTKKSNSKQGSSSQHANEKNLQEILGITDEMLEPPTDAENSEVISVTDDDMEKTNEDKGSSSTTSTVTEPSLSSSVPLFTRIVPQYSNRFQSQLKQAPLSVEDEGSSSTTSTVTEPSLNTKINFKTSSSQREDEKKLQEIMGITDEMLEAPTDTEDSEGISVTDDDMEKTNEDEDSSSTTSTVTAPSFSFPVPAYTRIEPQYSNGFQSQHKHERVKQILQCTEEEFKSMKNDSKLMSEFYLKGIKKTMNLEDEEILNAFYTQQKKSLDDESRAMIEFIKYVKNDFPDQDLFSEISNDILEALAETRKCVSCVELEKK